MADNVELNAGSGGATVRTDDDGTAHWQYVKLAHGADGTRDICSPLHPLPVALTDNRDIFQRAIVVTPENDIDVQFFRSTPETLLRVTASNGGTATQANGHAVFATGSNTSGGITGVSNEKTEYRSGSEVYAMFTAAFVTGGLASSYQRIGLYDANNGVFIGYEGTSFGVTYRSATSDTTVAQGSWTDDALSGAAGSRFTRGGTEEAIDLTKSNVWRIRFGWLGSAPAILEVMSPDGEWVVCHRFRFPNLQNTPSIQSADLPMTVDLQKTTAGATDLIVHSNCWGAGATITPRTGYVDKENSRFASTLSAGTSWNASGNWVDVHRYSLIKILLYTSTNNASGTLNVEFSMDGSTSHRTVSYTVDNAKIHPPHVLIPVAQFCRVSYTANAGGGNTHDDFTVQTLYHTSANKVPTSKVTSTLSDSSDVDNVRAVIAGENPAAGGSYVNLKVDSGGQLQVDLAADSIGLTTAQTIYHLVSAATTNATNVKASAGTLFGWSIFNTNASTRYVKLHNTAGTPTAGSGVVYTISVPGTGGTNLDLMHGLSFTTGIAITTVTEAADSGTTAVAANDLIINIHYT